MNLQPRVIFYSGILATGKSTVMKNLARAIPNAYFMDRDDINPANAHVSINTSHRLLPFEKYVANAGIFPDHARTVNTPFGEMTQVDPHNEYYRRHLRDQSYLIQLAMAKTALDCGKVPFIGCITVRQIIDGTLRKMADHESVANFPRYLVHFCADEKNLYERAIARNRANEAERKRTELIPNDIRTESPTSSREAFHLFTTEEQPMIPEQLSEYKHLLLNTSQHGVEKCVNLCLDYILNPRNVL